MQSTRFLLTFAVVFCGVRVAFAGSTTSLSSASSDDDDQPELCSYLGCSSVEDDCQEHDLPPCFGKDCLLEVKVKDLDTYVKRIGMCDDCILKRLWGLSDEQLNELLPAKDGSPNERKFLTENELLRDEYPVLEMLEAEYQHRTKPLKEWLMPLHEKTMSLMDVIERATKAPKKEDFDSLDKKFEEVINEVALKLKSDDHPGLITLSSLEDEKIPSLSPCDDNDQPELSPDGGSVVEDDDLPKCNAKNCQEKVKVKDLDTYVKKLFTCDKHFEFFCPAKGESSNEFPFVTNSQIETQKDHLQSLAEKRLVTILERVELESLILPLYKQAKRLMLNIEMATVMPKEDQVELLETEIGKLVTDLSTALNPKDGLDSIVPLYSWGPWQIMEWDKINQFLRRIPDWKSLFIDEINQALDFVRQNPL